jgi:hypothetical protein
MRIAFTDMTGLSARSHKAPAAVDVIALGSPAARARSAECAPLKINAALSVA